MILPSIKEDIVSEIEENDIVITNNEDFAKGIE
jgi:hypothetical protein